MARKKALAASVGVRELRQNLSIYLDRVKRGEALTVTEHGQAVAILRPLAAGASVLDRLVAEGRATPPTRAFTPAPPIKGRLNRPLAALLDEMRKDRV